MLQFLLSVNHVISSAAELSLAALMAHKAIPTMLSLSKIRAWKMWLLVMALALFGISHLPDLFAGPRFVDPHGGYFIRIVGQWFLIAHAFSRYQGIKSEGLCPWGETKEIRESGKTCLDFKTKF